MTLPQDKPHITAGEIFKIKRKYDIFSYLSNIPGISSETLEILKKSENFKNNELKILSPLSTDESDSQSFWDSLQSTSYFLPIPEFSEDILSKGPKGPKNPKGFKISIKNVNPFSYLFIKSPYRSRKMDSSGKDYAIDDSIVDKIAPLWLYKETLPLAPVLSLIMLSYATHKDPNCFPRKIGLPEKVCFPANVCYYLSELSPSVREARFSSYYPSKHGRGSYAYYFSDKAITHEYWLQICALCMLLVMASENLAARNKAGGKIHTQCSLRWNVYEQAVLFSLLIATPFDILLNWKELAEQIPELDCGKSISPTDSASQRSATHRHALPSEFYSLDPQASFELYIYTALAPLFGKPTETYATDWQHFSSIMSIACRTSASILDPYCHSFIPYRDRHILFKHSSICDAMKNSRRNPSKRFVNDFYISACCTGARFAPYYKVLSKRYDNEIDFNKEVFTQFTICMHNKFLHKSKTVSRLGPGDDDYVVPDEEILGDPAIQPLANAISNIADYHVFERTRRRFLASWEPYPGALQSLRIEDDP